ncbi:glycerol-3-phosphate 1-O-acyltransferase PlsY [Candidatus Marithrix sp. Canyon 246]|uniref:glycerol-3-phosphate 1-O-acyltransferase PlsY n=1 Tax=Candidatus Marithrix sp. Canyon 246 TaxID=1827136 RepID=UPI00084A005C|nr:glycerol-3-phosphate 1-O-acyltransferase PlsY [Candidatus Marithrix sp. Canyon 246]
MLINSLLIVGAYLLGSISGAIVVTKLMNLTDPRTQGSGNPGATNVLRHSGKTAALLTLLIDINKAVVAVWIAILFTDNVNILAAVGLAAFLGHVYPIFFNFKGGKGVATALGILLILTWQVGVAALVTWLMVALVLRYSSLAAISAAIFSPVYMYLFTDQLAYVVMSCIITALLLWRHRSNIDKLLNGKEDKIGKK